MHLCSAMVPVNLRWVGIGFLAAGVVAGTQLFAQPFCVGAYARRRGTATGTSSGAEFLGIDMPHTGRQDLGQTLTGLLLASSGVIVAKALTLRHATPRRKTPKPKRKRAGMPPPAKKNVFEPSEQIGAVPPLGYFDPLGLSSEKDKENFRKLRIAEIKHGRVAMMAALGLLGQPFLKWPGFEPVPAGFKALTNGIPAYGPLTNTGAGFLEIVAISGIFELLWSEDDDKEPGDFGDPGGLLGPVFGIFGTAYDTDMRNKEISNGRFAMIAVLGMFAAEIATGKDAAQQLGLQAIGSI